MRAGPSSRIECLRPWGPLLFVKGAFCFLGSTYRFGLTQSDRMSGNPTRIMMFIRTIAAGVLLNMLVVHANLLACAPAPRPGQFVRIAEETAAIVWDASTNTEHFIRSANFDTDASDFGFLVPTPSVPKLTEADNYLFTSLEYRIRPEVVEQYRIRGVDLMPLVLYPF